MLKKSKEKIRTIERNNERLIKKKLINLKRENIYNKKQGTYIEQEKYTLLNYSLNTIKLKITKFEQRAS